MTTPFRQALKEPLTPREFRVIAVTTLGYYLVRDVVTRTWLRRAGQTAVVAGGVGVLAADQWKEMSEDERGEVRASLAQMKENLGANSVPGLVVSAAAPAAGAGAVLGAAAWFTGRVDAAGAGAVRRIGGRIPLVGGVFRALPSTVFGAAQVGVLYVVNERARR
ncbi:hypothetical protein [Corynebacterium sp.]|uniref:hypothetical protein n=1 Tax=Corynebacterium sp. TaxID=1720 RepID=UPI003B3B8BE6